VVFYSADYDNLLPVVHYPYYRGKLFYDEQESFEKDPVLVPGLRTEIAAGCRLYNYEEFPLG
jgi:hypothetical protein